MGVVEFYRKMYGSDFTVSLTVFCLAVAGQVTGLFDQFFCYPNFHLASHDGQ
jgi:hypothetical protein